MTSPVTSMLWHPAVRDILGLQGDVDPSRVKSPDWIVFDFAFTEQSGQKPWAHYMPEGPGKDWNAITLYRYRTTSGTNSQGGGTTGGFFQLVRAKVPFYQGTGDGNDSPSKQADGLISANNLIFNDIGSNQYLSPVMFRDVATRFMNVWLYLLWTGEMDLNMLYKEIEDSGVVTGDAADAFRWAMRDMSLGMQELAKNISTKQGDSWTEQLGLTATAIEEFKTKMAKAWSDFVSYQYHNPNTLVDALLKSMESQVDNVWNTSQQNTQSSSTLPWNFDFSAILSQGSPYNLLQQDEWVRLNTAVRKEWYDHWEALDKVSTPATQSLIDAYNNLLTLLGRGVIKLPHTPYPGLKPPNEQGLNELQGNSEVPPPTDGGGSDSNLPPTEGGGSDSNLPSSDGSGSETPFESGGSDSNLLSSDGSGSETPFESGGSGSNLPPPGSNGGTPLPDSLVSGADFGGGPDSSGVDSFGSGSSDVGGSGGFNGSGFNGPGLDGPGLDGSGLGIGSGLVGAGLGPGGSGGSSGDSRRSGVVGAGFDDDLGSGAGIGGGSDIPFPLDPNAIGSGGFEGLDPNNLGTGGFSTGGPSGLDPGGFDSGSGFGSGSGNGSGSGSGFSVGPLGTPPPGYTPSPITNLPASAVTGAASSSGGENIGGLLGATATPTPTPTPAGGPGVLGGMGGMPFMPPMMGSPGGNDKDKDRERTTWLTEEEDLWGTNQEVTAAVIGREDTKPATGAQPTRRPARPRKPEPTQEPTRGHGNR